MSKNNFATAICCIDGRFHTPLVDWIKKRCQVEFVDLVTEAGPDLVLAEGDKPKIFSIKERVSASIQNHKSKHLIVAAHDNCGGNQVTPIEHCQHLRSAKDVIRKWDFPVEPFFVFIDLKGNVEEV